MLSRFPDPLDLNRIDVRLAPDADVVPIAVLDAYGLKDASVTRLNTGSFNIHFRVESERGTFDLRRSNRPVDHGNLQYEVELLQHLRKNGFDLVPEVIPATDGSRNWWSGNDGWTLFRWIEKGESGAETAVTDGRVAESGKTLARFHMAVAGFEPLAARGDFSIFARPEDWPGRWASRPTDLARLLGPNGDDLQKLSTQLTSEIIEVDFSSLPQLACHCDYRLRNLKFEGDRVSTVFDLDTSMITTRLLDLGGAATRFSRLGGEPQADVEPGSRFLRTYDDLLPLSEYEWQVLPVFIRWRLIRDVTIYYDQWWLRVGNACRELFDGAADEMVRRARSSTA